jgi:signal transduction histidine kinase
VKGAAGGRRGPTGLPGSRWQRTADYAFPILVTLFLLSLVEGSRRGDPKGLIALGLFASVIQGAALWWRRAYPVVVYAIALIGGLAIHLVAPEGVFPVAGLIALATVAALRPLRVSLPALALLLGLTALNFESGPAEDAGFAMAFPIVAWSLGEVLRNRRVAIEQGSRRAVADEQARIARELHDVIAHSVSVIVVQAAAADDVFDERPDQARAALRSIESTGRDALVELRRLLADVRSEGDEPARPQPGLARIAELAAPLRAAGLEVTLREEGAVGDPLPAGVDLSAYRIVQEALTNTLRHAGASRAEVTIRAGSDLLELEILDDGRGGALVGEIAGRGIAGMRERTAMLGGTLDAGPVPGGGFRVHARLPLEAGR